VSPDPGMRKVCSPWLMVEVGNSFRGDGPPRWSAEAGQARRFAYVGGFHAIQISLPCGAADGDEAVGADGVDGSIFVHAVGKLEMYQVVRMHSQGTSGPI
jgi:hypothetical protein